MRCPFAVPLCLALAAASPAQEPTLANAGYGAIYRDIALDPITGNVTHLGVVSDPATGHFFVSATGTGGMPPHLIYELDADGALLGSFPQPAVHNVPGFGMRDLESDGSALIGGSEVGISVFSTTGAPVNQILTQNGPRPIVQPITGPVASLLGVFRAIALDPTGNGGNGSLLVADFGSPIYEIDLQGNVLATFPNQGWSAYGLTIDPVTGNPWVFAGPSGRIEELDRATMMPTGHRLAPIGPGAQGGLALASATAGHYEPWGNSAALVHLVQGVGEDRIGVQRLHLYPNLRGWDELQLRTGVNGGTASAEVSPFWYGDTLDFLPFDPTGLRNGLPAWLIFNVYFDASRDAYTDLSPVFPGFGILVEHRSVNTLSVPTSPNFVVASAAIGNTTSWTPPPSLTLVDRDLFRIQALYFEPASPQSGIASTNEAHWQASAGERGIVVVAEGPTSFNGGSAPPFWRVTSDLTHGHGTITAVELSTVGAVGPAALQRFDIDQNSMSDRFDGGNSALAGHRGTYRNGSDVVCGLNYGATGVYVAPFHGSGESSGVAFSVPPDTAGYVPDLLFEFTGFTPGRAFEFDCDTDGGPPTGSDHAGLVVRVKTSNSGVLTGVLAVDPTVPNRASVWFP
ncbi:MAG: hypothetical protein KDE27_02045 [Planctomycetes bacterium]|nr:hypothetical protein [Planctomycetota bacterium]